MNPSVRCSVGRRSGSYTSKLISEHFFTPYSLINSDGCFFSFTNQFISFLSAILSLYHSLPHSPLTTTARTTNARVTAIFSILLALYVARVSTMIRNKALQDKHDREGVHNKSSRREGKYSELELIGSGQLYSSWRGSCLQQILSGGNPQQELERS